MKAALLVGGVGTRMRPLTYLVPKPMLPLAGKPLLERTLDYLKGYGFEDLVLCVAYLKKQIMDYFKDGSDFGVRIEYAESDSPLGTAGQLRTARTFLETESEPFLAMNGDIFTSLELDRMVKFHHGKEVWDQWNRMFARELVQSQTVLQGAGIDGKDIGYWEAPGGKEKHGLVYNTTLCALMLQVYYRYLPTYQPPVELDLGDDLAVEDDVIIEVDI